jgi:hypothetical protein
MEVTVELDERLVEELEEEVDLQGFDDLGAYMRWIVAHRPMSELATTEAAAVASRVSELEERLTVVERQLDLDGPVNPDADLGNTTTSDSLETAGGPDPEENRSDESVELDDPDPEPDEDAAQDDEIAEALEDVSLDDEDED